MRTVCNIEISNIYKPKNQGGISMIKKVTTPILGFAIGDNAIIGTRVEYRLFGILLYRKELYTPQAYGIHRYERFHASI